MPKKKKPKSLDIHQSTDKLFKKIFEFPDVIQELVNEQLPKQMVKHIDFSTLQIQKNTFINKQFRAKETDLLYSVKYKDETIFIYLLVEMQTTVDKDIVLRLMGYLQCFFDLYRKQHSDEALPLVCPLVIYSGEKIWDAPLNFFDMFGKNKNLAKHLLTQDINFVDIQRLPDETIEKNQFLGLFEYVVKYRKTKNLLEFLIKAFSWIEKIEVELHNGREYASIIINYMYDQLDTEEKETFIETVNHYLSEETRGEVMTLKQAFIAEGEQRGIHIGEQRGIHIGEQRGIHIGEQRGYLSGIRAMVLKLWNKGMKKEEIANLTDLDLRELEELLKDVSMTH